MRITDKHIFFWTELYSQWHIAEMIDPITNITYNCSEQYMMHKKALLFGDNETATKILETKIPREQKALGRLVKGFSPIIWDQDKYEIVCNACMLKFTQNPILLAELLNTGNKILVEASPYDKIWGIGMKENDEGIDEEENWKGENLLGYALNDTRNYIKNLLLDTKNLFVW